MRSAHALLVGALLAAALAAGCGGSSTTKKDGGGNFPGTGGSSATGGKTGTGGSGGGFGGAGGSNTGGASGGPDAGGESPDGAPAGGSGGSSGTGGSAGGLDAGAADSATGPSPPPPRECDVEIRAVSPLSFDGLPAGPGSRLRVEAVATGPAAPKVPVWDWTVVHQNSGLRITPTPVEMDPAVVEFPLASPGSYLITAQAPPSCRKVVTATATDHPVARFWLRVVPRTSEDQPLEGATVDVPAGTPVTRDLTCGIGTLVSIDPRNAGSPAAVFSYVRITSEGSTVRIEGHTGSGALNARLDPTRSYDVLVIPDGDVAPARFSGTPSALTTQFTFDLDKGLAVSGQITSSKGPLTGARMFLQNGIVPSTTGVMLTTGHFDLLVRSGSQFAAVIIPPLKSGLPEARLAAGSGLAIYDCPVGPRTLDFAWDAIDTATLELNVADSTGVAVKAAVRVRLVSADDAFPDVGTLTFKLPGATPSAPDQRFEYHPSGFVQLDDVTDARGSISFTDVPRGRYQATLSPLDGTAAITTVAVDLTGSARVVLSPRLARKVSLSGKLSPTKLTSGATVVALDAEADPAVPPPAAIVNASGSYTLYVDPGRSYALVLEADPTRALPRTFLRSIVAPDKDSVREDVTVPGGLSLSGRVTGAQGPVAGALVQAYCIGAPPACIDSRAPDITNVRPTAEAISDGNGAYRLLVPDPAIAN